MPQALDGFKVKQQSHTVTKQSGAEARWPRRVRTAGDAVRFIDAVGYCLKVPIKNLPLPSLYYAVAGRPPHGWDLHYEKIWHWKDDLPRRRRAFYAKYFKGRGTFISLKLLPHFLAMEGTAVAPSDHARFYAEGRISADARAIWEALERHGPLATLELRYAVKMQTTAGNIRFKRAMLELERKLVIVHFGTEQETAAWASGRFELTCRAFAAQTAAAHKISPAAARAAIAAKYLEWQPAAPLAILHKLFGWSKSDALAAAEAARRG